MTTPEPTWTVEQACADVALACEESAHAYFRDGADPIHGVCGLCACGSTLYTLTGDLIDGA